MLTESLIQTVAILQRTPAVLNSLLRDLPGVWTSTNEGPGTWSAFDVVGHLIHGERTEWVPRAKMILEFGETKTFEKFDRTAQEQDSRGKSLDDLLDEFMLARRTSLNELRALHITHDHLARRGRHPAFGSVTLGQLLSTWAAHDLTHFHQLSRVMAHQVREDVGPWTVYLGVMQCAGHRA
jgi:hypothetical protein